jgi:hypothetical protein
MKRVMSKCRYKRGILLEEKGAMGLVHWDGYDYTDWVRLCNLIPDDGGELQ